MHAGQALKHLIQQLVRKFFKCILSCQREIVLNSMVSFNYNIFGINEKQFLEEIFYQPGSIFSIFVFSMQLVIFYGLNLSRMRSDWISVCCRREEF